MGDYLICIQEVMGSSPIESTRARLGANECHSRCLKNRHMCPRDKVNRTCSSSSIGGVSALQAECCGFKSRLLLQ